MLCRLMSLLVYKYGLYPAFEKAGISPDFVLNTYAFWNQKAFINHHRVCHDRILLGSPCFNELRSLMIWRAKNIMN